MSMWPKLNATCSPSSWALDVSAALTRSASEWDVAKFVASAAATEQITASRHRTRHTIESSLRLKISATALVKPVPPTAGPAVSAAASALPTMLMFASRVRRGRSLPR